MAKVKLTVFVDEELRDVAKRILARQGKTMSGKVSLALFAEIISAGRDEGLTYNQALEKYLPGWASKDVLDVPVGRRVDES